MIRQRLRLFNEYDEQIFLRHFEFSLIKKIIFDAKLYLGEILIDNKGI